MNTITKTNYAKRRTRLDNPPDFKITLLALQVNAEICRRPLIRMDQLFELFPKVHPRTLYDIVFLLFHNGFIAKPGQQSELHPKKGSAKSYLNAEPLGLVLHYAFFRDPVAKPRFTQDSSYRTFRFMIHKHNETTGLLNYQRGIKSIPSAKFKTEAECWTGYVPTKNLNQPLYDIDNLPTLTAHEFIDTACDMFLKKYPSDPLVLKACFDWGIHLPKLIDDDHKSDEKIHFCEKQLTTVTLPTSVQPDGYFSHGIQFEDFFFFESDEENETILPGETIRQSANAFNNNSLFAKYASYIAAFRKFSHLKQFGINSFQVVTETKTFGHMNSIIAKLAPIFLKAPFNIHPEFLLFYDRDMLARCDNNPYHPNFRYKTLANDYVQLLPR